MAILSNGKFYGFLCSAKETGQKLANGAKEYVENFVSGFAGHGWKIWEYVKGKWMLEIDSIRVRGQFTVFEMLVSKIRAIIGSQAITQGHAKVKSVIVADCEVHKELRTERYAEDFTEPKWEKLAADNLVITQGMITVNGSSKYSPTLFVESANYPINSFGFTVTGLKGSIQLTWTDEKGTMQLMEITEDGEYEYPQSYQLVDSPFETQRVGIIIHYMEDSLTIKQGVSSFEYSDFVTTEPCYSLEIEDEINTISEYDFIKCQKPEKTYHVQVGSISEKYINIPISEFDVDDEGNVTNPPEVGDEIVQFGNSSHLEAYTGRHSAIYMHADEGLQPAIDVLDGIYSKDWADCLKVRMGGDIPGTTLKGFYSVNGIIKGVNELGHTVYCLYPDGTAELGDSSALFRPDKSGYIAGGSIAWEWNEEKKKYVVSMDDVQVEWTNLKDSLGWINEWTEKGTTIGDKFVAAPTGFFGKQDKDEKMTGILMGKDVKVKNKNENGEIVEELRTGIFALVDDEVVFELDPITEKYVFKGTVESDMGRIGGFNIKTYGLQNVEGRDCYVSMTNKTQIGYENGKEIYSERTATIGNSLSAIFGIKEVARMSYTGKEYDEHSVLSLIATGSIQKYKVFGGYANLCINATGGCNWNMNSGDHWCMPGMLGIVRFSCTYANYTYTYRISTIWGNGIPNVSGYINDPNENSRVIIVNIKMGHNDYSVIGQVVGATAKEGYWDMNAHTEFMNESSFGISVWNNNKKYIPSVLDMFIIGRPYIDA